MQSIDENVLTSMCEIEDFSDNEMQNETDIAEPFSATTIKSKSNKGSFIGSGLRLNTQDSVSKRNQFSRNIYEAN